MGGQRVGGLRDLLWTVGEWHSTVVDGSPVAGTLLASPLRIVLASLANVSPASKLVASARQHPVWVFCGPQASAETTAALESQGVTVTRVAAVGGQLWLPAVMAAPMRPTRCAASPMSRRAPA